MFVLNLLTREYKKRFRVIHFLAVFDLLRFEEIKWKYHDDSLQIVYSWFIDLYEFFLSLNLVGDFNAARLYVRSPHSKFESTASCNQFLLRRNCN